MVLTVEDLVESIAVFVAKQAYAASASLYPIVTFSVDAVCLLDHVSEVTGITKERIGEWVDSVRVDKQEEEGSEDMLKRKKHCQGCEQDFYNDNNPLGVKECWHLKSAEIVHRYVIGRDVRQDCIENFKKVLTYNCYREKGKCYYAELPSHLR